MNGKNDLVLYVDFSLSNFPKKLLSPSSADQIRDIARYFSGEIQKPLTYCFEVHLTDIFPKVDFLINLTTFQEHPSFISIPNNNAFDSAYPLYTDWQNSFKKGQNIISSLWFEFDIEKFDVHNSKASMYVSPFETMNNRCSQKGLSNFLNKIDILLKRNNSKINVVEKIHSLISGLPEKSIVSDIGIMLSRTPNYMRFVISNISTSDFILFLEALEWKWDIGPLDNYLKTFSGIFDEFQFTIDVDKDFNLTSVIGIECYFFKREHPRQEKRWAMALSVLKELGICEETKIDEVLNFNGFDSSLSLSNSIAVDLNHLKVVYADNELQSSKVYYFLTAHP